jgi:aspartyl-tRNA(Asn)/glutamyl-tRNA(Gln) amidotransferase subunit A
VINLYLIEKGINELSELIRNKEIKVVELIESQLERIDKTDSKIDAYLFVDHENALKAAKEIDVKISEGKKLSPLAGIPVAVKDNICTKGVQTTCASKILENFIPPYNATVVDKLNESDAVIVGKTNLDEFAMGGSTENSAFKKTKNPWDLDRVPGGSSGGSAAAVASDEAIFSLGSDTGGSIRQPAAHCGVVGFKPTYGAVSRYGLIAFASSLDQIGPFTKNVTDCALVLNSICGHDKLDSTSADLKFPDYTKSLTNDVKGMKIALPREYIGEGINDEVKNSILSACRLFEKNGAIVEEISLPISEYAIPTYYMLSSAEASSNLARYDGIKYGFRADEYKNLLDLYMKTRSQGFGPEVKRRIMLGTYALSSGYYDAYYKKAQKVRALIKKSFDEAFTKYDVIVGPTSPTTAFKLGEKTNDPLEMYLCDINTVSVNIAGIPAISLPCGLDSNNLPIGLQIIANSFEEEKILKAAYSFEQIANLKNKRPNL